jgi:hypothetical protein
LIDLVRPFNSTIQNMFKLGNELLFTEGAQPIFHTDPLVFDLTGASINLTALTEGTSPMLDMEGTGFAMSTGRVEPNDGILVLEQNSADGTPNITQMLGGPGAEGFAALAQYDVNGTGILDANKSVGPMSAC